MYYFLNEKEEIIYVGKSKDIRKRVASHFKSKTERSKSKRLQSEVKEVRFELTGSELIALLLESSEIKKHQPRYNRAQKTNEFSYGIYDDENGQGYITLQIKKINDNVKPLAVFKSYQEAERHLLRKADHYNLCPALCSLEPHNGKCFRFEIKQCRGACCGMETATTYNQRAQSVVDSYSFSDSNFLIIDRGRNAKEKSVVKVENDRYTGFGYFQPEFTGMDVNMIQSGIKIFKDTPDTRKIIHSGLRLSRSLYIVPLGNEN